MDALGEIRGFLFRLRRRLKVVLVVRDSGLFCAALALLLLVLILAASLLDQRTSLRALGLLLALPVLVVFVVNLTLALRRLRQEAGLAQLVGRRWPSLRSDLVSTVELARELESDNPRFSRALYAALARQTWRRLRRISLPACAPPILLRPAAVLLTVTLLAWATAAATLPDHLHLGASRLLSSTFHAGGEVATTLLVGDLKLVYRYPSHMARAPRTVQSSTGHITAPKGTRVDLEATALAPITSPAALVVKWRGEQPQRLGLTLRNDRLAGSVTVSGDGAYRFQVRTPDGRLVLDPAVRRIQLEPDALPRVTLYGPKPDLAVTMQHRLELGYTAEDDYGLTGIRLAYQVDTAPPERVTLWTPRKGARKRTAAGKHEWDLAGIDLHPGARVAFWLEALDNDTVSGPKVGRSSTQYFKVYSAEEKHRETLKQQERVVEQAIRVLADRLLLYEEEPAISPELRLAKNQSIHRSHGGLVDGLLELRNQMQRDPFVARNLLRAISAMHHRMGVLLKAEATALKNALAARRRNPSRPVNLQHLREHNRRQVAEMESDVLQLANLLDEQRLQTLISLSRDLQRARKRLTDLLQRYRKTRSEELRRQLLRQILRMQQQVAELMSRLSRLSASVPDEYLNAEALKDINLSGELSRLADKIRNGRLEQIEAALQALDQKLQQLGDMLASSLGEYRGGRMSGRERAFHAMLDQLRGLEAEQREIAARTQRVIRRYHRAAARLMKHRINPFVRQELAKLARLRRRVQEIDHRALPPYDQEQLDRVKQRVEDLRGMLDQGDLDQALRMALRTRNGLQVLQDDLAEEMEGQHPRRRAQLYRALRKTRGARKLADEMVADLRAIFPAPRSLLDRRDLTELRDQLRRQRALRRKLRDVGQQLEKGSRYPSIFGAELSQGIKESAHLMGKASDKLRGLQPQEAHGSQEAAADRLAQLRRQMEEARQPKQWGQVGSSVLRERIRIPGADAFRPPKEFRQDILDAMKEKPPGTYRNQVRRYYEELVR